MEERKRLRGAAEANPEIPRFPFASLWASASNRLRNPRSKPEIATLSFGKLAMTKKTKILGKLNYYKGKRVYNSLCL